MEKMEDMVNEIMETIIDAFEYTKDTLTLLAHYLDLNGIQSEILIMDMAIYFRFNNISNEDESMPLKNKEWLLMFPTTDGRLEKMASLLFKD